MEDSIDNRNYSSLENEVKGYSRRDLIKGIATIPVLGALAYGFWRKRKFESSVRENLRSVINLTHDAPVVFNSGKNEPIIRIGLIGYGVRGVQLLRAAGFAHPEYIDSLKIAAEQNVTDTRYKDFLAQDNLNIEITAVSDLFDVFGKRALEASANIYREGSDGKYGKRAKFYKDFRDLIRAKDVDAVIIATPDHWHTEMTIEAARNGKHVYLEKAMTRTVGEAFQMREAVKNSNIVFQLGHQGRQTESFLKAIEAVKNDIIGKINLIEVCTNRNALNGAWVKNIPPEAGPHNIDWKMFEEPCEKKHPFSLERFFRWRCWWDYGTGLGGDLLTHEYDVINQILKIGIPYSAVASGGVYFYKDKKAGHFINEVREVPDVWQATLEYPDKDFTLLYSATLASSKERGKIIMGHDGYMELGNNLVIYADRGSIKYRDKIQKGTINPDLPIFTYIPGSSNIDAVASATEKYFATRGLLYTYRAGKRVDTTFLHVKEWIDCIRESIHSNRLIQPSCNIDEGFDEAITAHMATLAYRENRMVFWDKAREKVI